MTQRLTGQWKERCPAICNFALACSCFVIVTLLTPLAGTLTWHDMQAFLAASHKPDGELRKWFHEHLIWDDPQVVNDLVKNGLFIRSYEASVSPPSSN